MIRLEGKNLREKHKDLNYKVKKAVENKVNLQEVECADNSDIDRIFKIDLASEYKNIDYIIEELKSGDSLYISRALKSKWLYTTDYEYVINPYYLHNYVFPKMSFRMKKKMLGILSVKVRDERRAERFYEYCTNILRLINIAQKFLIFASEQYKLNIMSDTVQCKELYRESYYFQHLIGNSFSLARAYAESGFPLIQISYLYSVNEENYLDLLETYKDSPRPEDLGVKISRRIMKKHKNRVLQNLSFYLSILSQKVILQYSSCAEIQMYLRALLPEHEHDFWKNNFCDSFFHYIDSLRTVSKFKFIKQIFEERYGTPDFELHSNFCELRYFCLMTAEEVNEWGNKVLEIQNRITYSPVALSEGNNYIWCEYMPFAKSLSLINYLLNNTSEVDRRSDMLRILVKSVRTKDDLEKLLNYYYNKHIMHEQPQEKLKFLHTVNKYYNVFNFNDACWVAFDMILQNFRLHDLNCDEFLMVSFIYRVIKDKTLPQHLIEFMLRRPHYNFRLGRYLERLTAEERNLVYQTANREIIKIILHYDKQTYVKWKMRYYVDLYLDCRNQFDIEDKIPPIILKYIKLDSKYFRIILREVYKDKETRLTEGFLLRWLKEDASIIIHLLPSLIDQYNMSEAHHGFRMNMLLRKIKIFFPNDVRKQCVEYFTKVLYGQLPQRLFIKPAAINGIVFAIFQLGDERTKTELMDKFTPINPKVERYEMNHKIYMIRIAICRFQCRSRPPVPLTKTVLYIKGDYLRKCEEMLYMHLSNLPPNLREQFITLLLKAPLPVQKRAVNLALQFTLKIDELRLEVGRIWDCIESIPLRKIIFILSFRRIFSENIEKRTHIFRLVLYLTRTLRPNDDGEIFKQFAGDEIPYEIRGRLLESCWRTLVQWPETNALQESKKQIAASILKSRNLMCPVFMHALVYEEIKRRFRKKLPRELRMPNELECILINLECLYITEIHDDAKQARSLNIVTLFAGECFKRWNDEHPSGIFYYREIYNIFMFNILKRPIYFGPKYLRMVNIGEKMLKDFENKIGIAKEYSKFWDWKLSLITRRAINGGEKSNEFVYLNFGNHLGHFVRKLKEKNCYFISFFEKVFGKILSSINDINQKRIQYISAVDASLMISFGLINIDIFDNHVLALKILPADLTVTPIYQKMLLSVLRRIQKQNNEELSAYIKEKFHNNEAKSRKLLKKLGSNEIRIDYL